MSSIQKKPSRGMFHLYNIWSHRIDLLIVYYGNVDTAVSLAASPFVGMCLFVPNSKGQAVKSHRLFGCTAVLLLT